MANFLFRVITCLLFLYLAHILSYIQGNTQLLGTRCPDRRFRADHCDDHTAQTTKKKKHEKREKCKLAELAKVIMHFLERRAGGGTANRAKWKSGSPSSLPDSFLKPTYLFPVKQQFKCFSFFFFLQEETAKKTPRGFFRRRD